MKVVSREIIITLLSAGGATFVWTVVQSILALRNNAESREDKAVARLEQFERSCREQLAYEREWGAYWSRRSATLERILLVNNIPAPQAKNIPTRGAME